MNKLKNIDFIVILTCLIDSSHRPYKVWYVGHVLNPNIKETMDILILLLGYLNTIFDLEYIEQW